MDYSVVCYFKYNIQSSELFFSSGVSLGTPSLSPSLVLLPLLIPLSFSTLSFRPPQGTSKAHQDSRDLADVDSSLHELSSSHRVIPQTCYVDQIWVWALKI